MNTSIRIKLLLLTITTLLVLGGAFLYYENMFEESKASSNYYAQERTFNVSDQDIVPIIGSSDDNHLTKHKPKLPTVSKKVKANASSQQYVRSDFEAIPEAEIFSSIDRPVPVNYSSPSVAGNSSQAQYTNQTVLMANRYNWKKRTPTPVSTSTAPEISTYSSSISSIPAPQLANGTGFANNGYDGNPDDPSDDFLPPEGAPVGGGLMALLALAGVYLFRIRRK